MEVQKVELVVGYPAIYDNRRGVVSAFFIREMTGADEDLLASKKLNAIDKLNQLLTNTTLKVEFTDVNKNVVEINSKEFIGRVVRGLNPTDKFYLLIRLRVLTYGEIFIFSYNCGGCNAKNEVYVNLNEMGVVRRESADYYYENVKLPSGKVVAIKVAVGDDADKLVRLSDSDPDFLSKSILYRIDKIDGNVPSLGDIKNLSIKDRAFLRQFFRKIEGEIDTKIVSYCKVCNVENVVDVAFDTAEFLFPSNL